ncbi:putative piggyBac transposable element-derived protein 4-like [Scophthalmus maximus]|uniref:Putative piggyBac transposable element-derived protein 4-like n=1 Tax=Scophthalmus maximus TaxID=52904 RepID=A0A2U9B396_SCOMX|nr:putative piggyBac transposable element-derived protein 4-like [Scophthalmus maximus]
MEEVSEMEDCTYYDEEEESTDEEESEEEDPAESEEYFRSKDETLIWSSIPPSDRRRMLTAERAERETSHHGPTAYAKSRIDDISPLLTCFCPSLLRRRC